MSHNRNNETSLSFAQQGTLDWVGLGDKAFEASLNILSRFSGANIDPFKLTVAQAIASQFHLSRDGKNRLKECLQLLKCFASLEDVLWCGFGIKHVIRILANTTHGISTITVCGSLSEVLSTEAATSILDELSETYGAPAESRPSLSQWEALLSSCAGTLSSTNFGLVAEQFMSFHEDSLVTPQSIWVTNPKTHNRRLGEPKQIALALQAIGHLSMGILKSIELRGNAVCGLLAAFGYWFLGLNVEIRKDGETVYRSITPDQPVQIIVSFAKSQCIPYNAELSWQASLTMFMPLRQ